MENISKLKFLIIRLSSIGDIILTSPFVRVLRNRFPGALIDFVTQSQFTDLLVNNPNIDNIYRYSKRFSKKDLFELKFKINNNNNFVKYDFIIDLQNNGRSRDISNNMGLHIFRFDKRIIYKLKLVYLKIREHNFELIPELYIKTASELGVLPDGKGLELWLDNEKSSSVYIPEGKRNEKNNLKRIAIAPGAAHATKRWQPEKFIELIKLLKKEYNSEFVIIGGSQDIEVSKKISLAVKLPIDNYTGNLSLLETTEELSKCDLLITNDSAAMHIAAARKTPVIAIFGSTVQDFGFIPYKTAYQIIEKYIPCRPCSHIGRKVCPKKHFNCMRLINTDDVLLSIRNLISK